jgi:glycosyltransferase involved in cell wall biosynthesis
MNDIFNDNDLRKKIIAKGYENVKRFSWNESAKKIVELIS